MPPTCNGVLACIYIVHQQMSLITSLMCIMSVFREPGRVLKVLELMGESTLAFKIPIQLL